MRQAKFAYWVGDYFPSVNLSLMLYEKLKLFYHHYADYRYYLSDRINEKFNYGKAVQTLSSRTVMWGVKPTALEKKSRSAIHLLSVGLIKESQGLVYLMDFLKDHSEFTLSIIGFCEPELYMKFMDLVRENILASRVFFPNKFYSERELIRYSKRCHIGIALYDEGNMTATYYTDPGKIKSYLEMGLPIIMTRTSAIEKYVKQFNCGEVVERNNNALSEAVQKIIRQYSQYVSGVEKINDFFNFETYYKNSFSILESYES
jgi:glycosyltransferase involved in cell wall biosynthesis